MQFQTIMQWCLGILQWNELSSNQQGTEGGILQRSSLGIIPNVQHDNLLVVPPAIRVRWLLNSFLQMQYSGKGTVAVGAWCPPTACTQPSSRFPFFAGGRRGGLKSFCSQNQGPLFSFFHGMVNVLTEFVLCQYVPIRFVLFKLWPKAAVFRLALETAASEASANWLQPKQCC